jgi:hypothetical protein
MSGEKPDYTAIIKSRKPPPTLDLADLRRRSAEATEATIVLQPSAEASIEAKARDVRPEPIAPTRASTFEVGAGKKETAASNSTRVPLRFSVSSREQHELRIQAALENRSVPELMRAIIADYLRANTRVG